MSKLSYWADPIGNSVLAVMLAALPMAAVGFVALSL
jgi:hypothetical protein